MDEESWKTVSRKKRNSIKNNIEFTQLDTPPSVSKKQYINKQRQPVITRKNTSNIPRRPSKHDEETIILDEINFPPLGVAKLKPKEITQTPEVIAYKFNWKTGTEYEKGTLKIYQIFTD